MMHCVLPFFDGSTNELMRIQNNGNIGIGTDMPDESALMDLSSNSRGILIPRMTTDDISQIVDPADGLQVYCTDKGKLFIYVGIESKWREVCFGEEIISEGCPPTFIDDRDGKVYSSVKIGDQCWMAENLNVGDKIDVPDDQMNNSIIEKYCYNNDEINCDQYGGLYQWNEIFDGDAPSGICPGGWHIPSDDEWMILEGTVDSLYGVGNSEWLIAGGWRGYNAGLNLKSTDGWFLSNNGADLYGFTAKPCGQCYFTNFNNLNEKTWFWTSTKSSNFESFFRQMDFDENRIYRGIIYDDVANSVRCIKDGDN